MPQGSSAVRPTNDLFKKLNKCGKRELFVLLNVLLLGPYTITLLQVNFSGVYQKLDEGKYTLVQQIEKEEYEPKKSCQIILLISVYKSDFKL